MANMMKVIPKSLKLEKCPANTTRQGNQDPEKLNNVPQVPSTWRAWDANVVISSEKNSDPDYSVQFQRNEL